MPGSGLLWQASQSCLIISKQERKESNLEFRFRVLTMGGIINNAQNEKSPSYKTPWQTGNRGTKKAGFCFLSTKQWSAPIWYGSCTHRREIKKYFVCSAPERIWSHPFNSRQKSASGAGKLLFQSVYEFSYFSSFSSSICGASILYYR
jgi:hypothetical protein